MSEQEIACILITEDEALLLDVVATKFEDAGFKVIRAMTAEDAIVVLEGEMSIDLLFTDIRLL